MNLDREYVIQISKKKVALLLLGAIALSGFFFYIAFVVPGNDLRIKIIAIFVLIFSACSIPLIITEFFNESPGLVISPRGITARFFEISWHQVKKVRVIRGFRIPDLLSLELYDRDSNIQIPATLLETSFDETTALIKAYHKKYGRR